jgi:predicted nucleic acid-binding protein
VEFVADTTVLVGLWRRQDWACRYARSNAQAVLILPWVVLGEFWNGAIRAGHPTEPVEAFLDMGIPFHDTERVIEPYARLASSMQKIGLYPAIGQNDLWIAAVAIALEKPLISRNRRHFDRMKGLKFQALDPA